MANTLTTDHVLLTAVFCMGSYKFHSNDWIMNQGLRLSSEYEVCIIHAVTEITHFQLLHSNILSYHHKPIKLYVSIYLWLLSGDMWYNWVLMNKSNPLQVINNLIVAYRNIQTKVFTMPFVTSIIWCVAINLWIYLICVNFWKIRNMTRWASAKRIWQVTWH